MLHQLLRTLPLSLALLFLGLAVLAPFAVAGEPVAIDDVPDAVVQSIEERFEGAELVKAEMETDDGRLEYDVTFRYQGAIYEAKFLEDGSLLEIERE